MRGTTLKLIVPALAVAAAQTAPSISQSHFGRCFFPVVTRVPHRDGVAITFDDGPDAPLEQFLAYLEHERVRATFFLMGEQVARYREAPALIAQAGHEVAIHGFTHRGHLRRTPWDLTDDLKRTRALVEESAQVTTQLYRPPYGVFSFGSWLEADRQHWRRVLWSRWGRDWEETATPELIADRIGYPKAGDVLLLHDSDRYSAPGSWKNTLGSLPIILQRIRDAGLHPMTVSDLLATADYGKR